MNFFITFARAFCIIGDKFVSESHRHFWTKNTIGHLGVGNHICYGDRKWDNHSVFVYYCITPERLQLLTHL